MSYAFRSAGAVESFSAGNGRKQGHCRPLAKQRHPCSYGCQEHLRRADSIPMVARPAPLTQQLHRSEQRNDRCSGQRTCLPHPQQLLLPEPCRDNAVYCKIQTRYLRPVLRLCRPSQDNLCSAVLHQRPQ